MLALALLFAACGGGGDGSGGETTESLAISAGLNAAVLSELNAAAVDPATLTEDPNVTLTLPGTGGSGINPGGSFIQDGIAFSAPAGATVTGIGIRFGSSGPINVIPLSSLRLRGTDGPSHKRAHKAAPFAGLDAPSVGGAAASERPVRLPGAGSDTILGITAAETLTGFGRFVASTEGATGGRRSLFRRVRSGPDVWFRWRAPKSGFVSMAAVDGLDARMDPMLTVWRTDGSGFVRVAHNDDAFHGASTDAQLQFPAQSGESYLVQVGNWSSADPAWTGTLAVTEGIGGSGSTSLSFGIPSNVCSNLSSICHQIICYEFAVTDVGTISRANIQQLAMMCGNCDEPSCRQLVDDCAAAQVWMGPLSFEVENCFQGDECRYAEAGVIRIQLDEDGLGVGTYSGTSFESCPSGNSSTPFNDSAQVERLSDGSLLVSDPDITGLVGRFIDNGTQFEVCPSLAAYTGCSVNFCTSAIVLGGPPGSLSRFGQTAKMR